MRAAIPPDDILEEYGKLSKDKKSAVTNLIDSVAYLLIGSNDTQGNDVSLDWQANQAMSIHLILGIILTGSKEYGRIWLEALKNKISRIT